MSKPKIKEVTVFTAGDSQKKSTWSSFPYNLTENLLSRGIRVNRIDISESEKAKWWFDRTIRRVARRIHPKTTYEYYRSVGHYLRVKKKIQQAILDFTETDVNIFMTFSHSAIGLTPKPTVMLCDWTYHYNITHFLGRAPDIFERSSIKREDRVVSRADMVVSTFPDVTDYMKSRYPRTNVLYFGKGFCFIQKAKECEIMPQKFTSKDMLFIGNYRYLEGAKHLISAYKKLQSDIPDIRLHIVGMSKEQLPDCPKGVICYGYLNKDNPQEQELYYKLLKKAKVFVNTTPKLGSLGAMLEALYFFTPVITTPQDYMVINFGDKLEFGHYCRDNSLETLCSNIKHIFQNQKYASLCANAHASVKGFSISSCIDEIINDIPNLSFVKPLPKCNS